MSSSEALASVTATLKDLLNDVVESPDNVTTKPPSVARNGNVNAQLNIFLYGVYYNTAFSNAPMPGQVNNGERGYPPMPLVLKYLITAYGKDDNDISGQQVMGKAMSILHDHPLLGPSKFAVISPDSNLQNQIERVRITPETLTLDDMSKLWTSFQAAEYRLSTAYEVSVVLIESTRQTHTPLPVLTRGVNDQGVKVHANTLPPYPTIHRIDIEHGHPSMEVGGEITIDGYLLDGNNATVNLNNSLLDDPILITQITEQSATQIKFVLDENLFDWAVGLYSLDVSLTKSEDEDGDGVNEAIDRTTNTVSLVIAPKITGPVVTNLVVTDGLANATLTLTCQPEIYFKQDVVLLLGSHVIKWKPPAPPSPPDPDPSLKTNTLEFDLKDIPVGSFFIRLRVDGVDSHLIDRSITPPEFDSSMEVTLDE